MGISVVRLGSPRKRGEGTRLGTARRPPRGVKKQDFARLDYYDVWVPDLAPSAALVSWATAEELTGARWKRFTKEYHREMKDPKAQRLIALLAALSHDADFSVGCYCQDESRCHRSLLRALLTNAGAAMSDMV
jgi:uncharacterized protein YeaO (DUF488 family)